MKQTGVLFSTALVLCFILQQITFSSSINIPFPFQRELMVQDPYLTGNDVKIAQYLLLRDPAVQQYFGKNLTVTGIYDEKTAIATRIFQNAHPGLRISGIFDFDSARAVLQLLSGDGVRDTGFTARSMGYLYKINIPVHKNRSIETMATLFDADNRVIYRFRARTHGRREDNIDWVTPDFGVGDNGLSQFMSNGNTVTGLVELDLNSPAKDPIKFGPYPINRIVRGLKGNAQFLLPDIRDGLLIHTGLDWSTPERPWNPQMDMPNSLGCIHISEPDEKAIYEILVRQGVEIHKNPEGGRDYPYKCQGVGVIELID